MAALVPQDESKLTCRLCGWLYDPTAGRVRGSSFECQTCSSADRLLRRSLGERPEEFKTFTSEETHSFYRQIHKDKQHRSGKYLNWQTVKAHLVTSLTQKTMTEQEKKVKGKFLPLSVYLQQGWEQSVVTACPSEWNEELGVTTYNVPVKSLSWKEMHAHIQEKVLMHEQAASKKKPVGRKTGDQNEDEVDVPVASKEASSSKTEKEDQNAAKSAQKLEKKTQRENAQQNQLAAKSVGPLTQSLSSLQKMYSRVKQEDLDDGTKKTYSDTTEKLTAWAKSCKDTMRLFETSTVQEGKEALRVLPFKFDEVKALQKTGIEAQKALKPHVPVPKSKAAAPPAAGGQPEKETKRKGNTDKSADATPAPKRRQTKTPP